MSISLDDRRAIIEEYLEWREETGTQESLEKGLELYLRDLRSAELERTLTAVAELAEQGSSPAEILDYIEATR